MVELPELPHLDNRDVIRKLARFVNSQMNRAGRTRAVVGISGGIDSSVVAALCVRALGADRVVGVVLPHRTTSVQALEDASLVIDWLGVSSITVDVSPMVDACVRACSVLPGDASSPDRVRVGNFAARQRMVVLFDVSQALDGLVVGTSNRSELLLGYGTLFGDMACSFNPLGDLYKTQVRDLATALGVPDRIRAKLPTADLWPGQTDEGEMGVTYDLADRLLYLMVDLGENPAVVRASGMCPPRAVDIVVGRVRASQFKRRLPPIGWVWAAPGRRPGTWFRRDYAALFAE